MSSDALKVSRSGAVTSANGERHIPASTRADGSVRKEIRIRPGYRPPEDVDVYKSRTAQAWRERGKSGVPGADPVDDKATGQSASTNKNAKRREARKAKAAAAAASGENASGDNVDAKPDEQASSATTVVAPVEQKDPDAEKEKEAKKLTKKLRQARDLKDKKDKGDALLPEQFEKVIRINELVRQLDSLGFDSNGEKKKKQQEAEAT